MLEKLSTDNKVVGAKQVKRAIEEKSAEVVFIAEDADKKITTDIEKMSKEKSIDIIYVENMDELGNACGIDVSAATAALLK